MQVTEILMNEDEQLTIRFKGWWAVLHIKTSKEGIKVSGSTSDQEATKKFLEIKG